MTTARNHALIALTAAGLLWGTSVPLSKVALAGFGPGWLTVIRFAVAGVILMLALRPRLRGNLSPALLLAGALGYGGCIVVQNLGLTRTSVTHAALLIGAVPVIVAGLAVLFAGARVHLAAWAGFGLSLAGIALVAGAGGGNATLDGDALVLLSVVIGSAFTLIQARLLPGHDVIAVSAGQFFASAALIAPIALLTEGAPWSGVGNLASGLAGTGVAGSGLAGSGVPTSALLATVGLATVGTVLPYTLFAFGQTGVEAQVAGAFLNLETLIAALFGATLFGEPMGAIQAVGAFGLLAGIYLSTGRRTGPVTLPDPVVALPEPRHIPEPRQAPESAPDYEPAPTFEPAPDYALLSDLPRAA